MAHQVVYLLEPGRFRAPRDRMEAKALAPPSLANRLFPAAGMKEAVEKIAAVYRKAGAAPKFSGRFYEVPHQFTQAMQDEAFAWFDRQLV